MNYLYKIIITIIFCIVVVSCNKKFNCKDLNEDYISLRAEIRNSKDSIKFLKRLEELTYSQPSCLKAIQLRGYNFMSISQFDSAFKMFKMAFFVDTSNVFTLYYLAMLYNFEKKNNTALSFINRAIEIKNPEGYFIEENNLFSKKLGISYDRLIHLRGIILFELSIFGKAKSDFLSCIAYHHQYYDTYGYLAAIYYTEKNIDSACFYHKKAIGGGSEFIIDTSLAKLCN